MDNKKICNYISKCRKEKSMTRQNLAYALSITNKAVSKWETGMGLPDISTLGNLSKILGVSVDSILKGEDSEETKSSNNEEACLVSDLIVNTQNFKKPFCFDLRKIIGILFGAISILIFIMQILYVLLGKRYEIFYADDKLFYIANALFVCMTFTSVILLLRKKKAILVYSIICFLILALNFSTMALFNSNIKSTISYAPYFKNTLVLRQNQETGKTVVCRNRFLWFVRPTEQFPYTVDENVKIQWLTNDICAVTYKSTDSNTHQYVVTYGDRGSGISYLEVTSALYGTWEPNDKNISGLSIRFDKNAIELKNSEIDEKYQYSDCVQFGTLAVVLWKDGHPKWTIALNNDCKIGADGLIEYGGTITICEVSIGKTAEIKLVSSTKSSTSSIGFDSKKAKQQGQQLKDDLNKILNKKSDLTSIENTASFIKVTSNSTDMFLIGRIALEENIKQLTNNGFDNIMWHSACEEERHSSLL